MSGPVNIPNGTNTKTNNYGNERNDNIVAIDMRSPSNVSRSAPEVGNFEYVLFAEVEGDLLGDIPNANFCRACKGVKEEVDGTMPLVDAKHVVMKKCTCRGF